MEFTFSARTDIWRKWRNMSQEPCFKTALSSVCSSEPQSQFMPLCRRDRQKWSVTNDEINSHETSFCMCRWRGSCWRHIGESLQGLPRRGPFTQLFSGFSKRRRCPVRCSILDSTPPPHPIITPPNQLHFPSQRAAWGRRSRGAVKVGQPSKLKPSSATLPHPRILTPHSLFLPDVASAGSHLTQPARAPFRVSKQVLIWKPLGPLQAIQLCLPLNYLPVPFFCH